MARRLQASLRSSQRILVLAHTLFRAYDERKRIRMHKHVAGCSGSHTILQGEQRAGWYGYARLGWLTEVDAILPSGHDAVWMGNVTVADV